VVTVGRTIFWEVTLCSPVVIQHHFGGMCFFNHQCLSQARNQQKAVLLLVVSCLAYPLTMKMEALRCSKMSVTCWTTWRYIPKDSTICHWSCNTVSVYSIEYRSHCLYIIIILQLMFEMCCPFSARPPRDLRSVLSGMLLVGMCSPSPFFSPSPHLFLFEPVGCRLELTTALWDSIQGRRQNLVSFLLSLKLSGPCSPFLVRSG
jgi:hypothetical protein